MPKGPKGEKRPADVIGNVVHVMRIATGEIEDNAQRAFEAYERMLEQGVAKEVARAVLPLSTYTKYYWSCNPRSLMHFCGLRNHENAQFEIHRMKGDKRKVAVRANTTQLGRWILTALVEDYAGKYSKA